MLVNPSGKVTEVSPVQNLNATLPMWVSPSGKVTDVSPLHLQNAFIGMQVKLVCDKFTEVRPLQS